MKGVRIDVVKGKQVCGEEAKKMRSKWFVNGGGRVLAEVVEKVGGRKRYGCR